jgi:hypothetical protein
VTSAIDRVGSSRWASSWRDRHLREDRGAEVAARQLADPDQELVPERQVEAERAAQARDVVGRREVAGDQRGRVARREMDQQEDDHRDHRHHR